MAKAFIIDPGLQSSDREHRALAFAWAAAAHENGYDAAILGHSDWTGNGLDGFEVMPVFGGRAGPVVAGDLPLATQLQLRQSAVRDSLNRSLRGARRDDVLVIASPAASNLNGVAAWAAGCPEDRRPRLIVWLHEGPSDDAFARAMGSADVVIAAYDRLRGLFGERVSFIAASSAVAENCRDIGAGTFPVLRSLAPGPQAPSMRRERMDMLVRLFPEPDRELAPAVQPADDPPQVDVVVTLHNYRRFIRQCLESVARQSYPNWRCIVVDDASTDLSFAEGRALVASFGPRFSYERHQSAQGQLRAVATGVSLGSGPFIALLDADDYLDEQALDHHVAWHLNRTDPVAMTSGGLVVVDIAGTRVASALDHGIRRNHREGIPLSGDAAFVRPSGPTGHGTARLYDPTETTPGLWFWNPTSTMVFRRSVVELIMPEEADVGRYAGDTYLSLFAHELGGTLCFSATVAYYRRHGDNGYSGAPVVGIGTLPVRENYPTWPTVAPLFHGHLRARMSLFEQNVSRQQIERLLDRLSGSRAAAHAFRHSHSAAEDSHGAVALSAMPYPELLAYCAGRLWRGGTRRLLRRPVVPAIRGADQVSFSGLASHVVERTRRGLARRFHK
jgi:hypothetical protein